VEPRQRAQVQVGEPDRGLGRDDDAGDPGVVVVGRDAVGGTADQPEGVRGRPAVLLEPAVATLVVEPLLDEAEPCVHVGSSLRGRPGLHVEPQAQVQGALDGRLGLRAAQQSQRRGDNCPAQSRHARHGRHRRLR
jgi:hypothetical protein